MVSCVLFRISVILVLSEWLLVSLKMCCSRKGVMDFVVMF